MEESFPCPAPTARKTRLAQAEARTAQAETRTEQAKTRIEAAKSRIEQAETRIEQAETRIESAKTRAEQAESRAEEAESRVEQAEALIQTLAETLAGGPSDPVPPASSPADEADHRALKRLTTRQHEVLELIAMGENTKQIADTLHLSPKTVEYHRKKLMDSLVIHDVPGLVRFALRVGLIGLVPAKG
jgi:DNA-binding NarL/FixJ family response regulator